MYSNPAACVKRRDCTGVSLPRVLWPLVPARLQRVVVARRCGLEGRRDLMSRAYRRGGADLQCIRRGQGEIDHLQGAAAAVNTLIMAEDLLYLAIPS